MALTIPASIMLTFCRKQANIVLLAKSDSDVMFCLKSYQGLIIDISLMY